MRSEYNGDVLGKQGGDGGRSFQDTCGSGASEDGADGWGFGPGSLGFHGNGCDVTDRDGDGPSYGYP